MDGKDESPARGLKNILKKKRGSRDDGASTLDSQSPTRDSVESLGRVAEEADTSGDSKISKLIPGLGKRREKRRRKSQANTASIDNLQGTPKSSNSLGLSPSASTLNDERSSLLTSDSDDGEVQPRRSDAPPLLSHESHAGYLTSTSPEIRATAVPASPALSFTKTPSPRTIYPLSKATTLPASRSGASPSQLDIDNMHMQAAASASDFNRSRSISPASKSADVASKTSGNLAARRLSRGSDSGFPPNITVSSAAAGMSNSNHSIPSIVTVPDSPTADTLKEPPKTTITPPSPIDGANAKDSGRMPAPLQSVLSTHATKDPHFTLSASGNTMTHRRSRSDSNTPSKLSYTMSAPLTPTLEEVRTPGSRNASGATASSNGGFFSSVFSAAQNAANTLSTTLGNSTTRPRSSPSQKPGQDGEDSKGAGGSSEALVLDQQPASEISKTPAIDTIGSGDLSLSHLGISSDVQSINGSIAPAEGGSEGGTGRSRSGTVIHREGAAARQEGLSAARAVSEAYGESGEHYAASTPVAEDVAAASKPSANDFSFADQKAISNGNPLPDGEGNGLFRSGSLRSSVRKRSKRQRNSSGTGGSTIGAAIAASHSAIGTPASTIAPKITGFAVANKKRNKDFHQFFRSVPEDDYLIEDYSCALQRDIILAGRIYISEGHICFSSNILGWVTTLVISFDEVVSVEKESTAMLFANAIAVQTLHARHTFRSLLSRDATYDLVIGIWKISHPGLQSSENGVKLVTGTGTKTEKVDLDDVADGSEDSIISGEIYDEDDEDDSGAEGTMSLPGTREASVTGSDLGDLVSRAAATRKPSAMIGSIAGQAAAGGPVPSDARAAEKAANAAALNSDFPGPPAHAPTECSDTTTHYEKLLKDEVIPAPLGKVYSLVFGAASGGFMSRWLLDDVKVTDLQIEDDKKGLTEDKKARSFSYIKPLNAPIGPKTTKCIITEQLDAFDLEKAVSVTVTTQTPDVPSGNLFSTKTRYCFMWGPNNGTRIIMCFALEWTGKSWIKGAIEKGANDGQITYANDLIKALRVGLSPRPRTTTSLSKGRKVRKRKSEGDALKSNPTNSKSQSHGSSWGLLEPLHKLFSPTIETCKPLFTLQSLVGLLVFLLIISWFGNSRHRISSSPQSFLTFRPDTAQRMAAYEELWRSEEAALWEWLAERVGMGGEGMFPTELGRGNADSSKLAEAERARLLNGMASRTGSTSERELDWAIKLTEEKLELLKRKVQKGKRNSGKSEESQKAKQGAS